jgi:hypothetical protein
MNENPLAYVKMSQALYALYNTVQAHAALLPGECADVYRAMVEVEAAERAWWEAFDALPMPQQSQAEKLLIVEAEAEQPYPGLLMVRAGNKVYVSPEEEEESPERSGELDPDVGPFRDPFSHDRLPWE